MGCACSNDADHRGRSAVSYGLGDPPPAKAPKKQRSNGSGSNNNNNGNDRQKRDNSASPVRASQATTPGSPASPVSGAPSPRTTRTATHDDEGFGRRSVASSSPRVNPLANPGDVDALDESAAAMALGGFSSPLSPLNSSFGGRVRAGSHASRSASLGNGNAHRATISPRLVARGVSDGRDDEDTFVGVFSAEFGQSIERRSSSMLRGVGGSTSVSPRAASLAPRESPRGSTTTRWAPAAVSVFGR